MSTATQTNRTAAKADGGVDMDAILAETQRRLMERPELLQMRMENETIMADCKVHPRDLGRIKNELAEMLRTFPEFADEAIYSKPCGKDDDGKETIAEDLSIRAAEALAEAYGYNRVRGDVTPLDEFHVKIDATFTDFQTGRIWQDGAVVSKYYTARGGGRKQINEDRFHNIVVKAAKSKLIREVIIRSVNPALKAWFKAECYKILGETINAATVQKWVDGFAKGGVTLEQLERFVGKPRSMGWTKDDDIRLLGVWNAIKQGETTVQEVFAIQRDEPERTRLHDVTEQLANGKRQPDNAPSATEQAAAGLFDEKGGE